MHNEIIKDLETEFDDFHKARVCSNQESYAMAAELYSEGLTKASHTYKEDDPRLCHIYIDYSHALIQNCENFFTNEISLLSNHQRTSLVDKQHAEDDLQVAWDLLEISRVVLAKEKYLMSRIYYLLGEILVLNNNFRDAMLEYTNSIALLKPENPRYCECLFKIASCHEFLKCYGSANQNLQRIVEVCKNNVEVLGEERVNSIVEEIQERINANKEREFKENNVIEKSSESVEEDKPVIDITKNLKKK